MRIILTFLGAALLALASPALATVAQYEVRGVKAGDKLNVRAAPSPKARIVGRIPHRGREIEIINRGRGPWVKIAYGRLQGYVNRRHLALSKRRVAAPVPAAAAVSAPAAAAAGVTVEPKALETPAVAPSTSPAPSPALAKPETPPAPETAMPGSKEEGDETPALMKPPAELMPERVPESAPAPAN
jgi:hypothetical protein